MNGGVRIGHEPNSLSRLSSADATAGRQEFRDTRSDLDPSHSAFWILRAGDQGPHVELARAGCYQMGLANGARRCCLGDWVFAQSWTVLRAPMFATLAFS